ncbi:MAG TPA: MFS transporter [Bryobacteraceae bacterium]|jgi:predicted MFS family arabinose efflux permease|nr:MFS transporter [Bryobacteraceae bacterium]
MADPVPVALPHARDGAPPQPRTRTAAVVLAGFCAFLALFAPQPLLPLLATAFHASAGQIGWVVTVSTLAVAMAAPLTGIVADRFGRKNIIVPAAFLLAIPTILAGLSGSLTQLLIWRFWQGIFTPGIFAVTIAYITEEWEQGAGAAMSAYVGGTVLGGFAGRMVAALAASAFSWRWAFISLGVLNLLGGVAVWAWLPAGRKVERRRQTTSSGRAMLRHLRNPRLLATYGVGFCVLFTLIATFNYVNFYLAAPPFGLGTAALGLLFTVYLVGAFVTPLVGRLIDRLGHRLTLALAFGGGIAGIFLTLVPSLPVVVAGLALSCTASFIGHSSASSYIGIAARDARASAVGLYVMFYYIGGSAGSALSGHVWNFSGWTGCVLLVAAVRVFTIAIAGLFWKPAEAA